MPSYHYDMMKRTILIRSTAALVSGLFLAPVALAAGASTESEDVSIHTVAAKDAAAPGAAKQKPAPAPVQKMRITANGVVPDTGDEGAATAAPAPAASKTATKQLAKAPAAEKKQLATSNGKLPAKPAAEAATPSPKADGAGTAIRIVSETPVRQVPQQNAAAPEKNRATDKKTVERKVAKTPAPANQGKSEAPAETHPAPVLADGLTLRITADGIIPESEYALKLDESDSSLAEKDVKEDSPEDTARKVNKALSGTSKPYVVNGIRYAPMGIDEKPDFTQVGIASWYGPGFHGRKTANGETFNQNAMTAAHKRLPISSYVRVTRVSTGKSIIVRINDRGPFVGNRVIDLSYGAAKRLGIVNRGSDKVKIEQVSKEAALGERNTETEVKAKKML